MLCEKCHKNPATVIIKQTTVDGNTVTKHLCPACSFKFEIPISFDDLFQGFLQTIQSMAQSEAGKVEKAKSTPCPSCGMSFEQFKSTGKLGCAECYNTFTGEMEALLKNVQGSIRHEGKYPRRSGVSLRQRREADQLRSRLKNAVEQENYEEAASLRDRIRALEGQEVKL
jgi:protein arginine kinase activator